jgi:hypothetical protein
MAFNIQYAPATTNPVESFFGGMQGVQKGYTSMLEQQKSKKELNYLDRKLSAEIEGMLALTEQRKADTAMTQAQAAEVAPNAAMQRYSQQQSGLLSAMERQLKEKYGAQQAQADINYKNAIGSSAVSNSQIADINARIAAAKLPAEIDAIKLQNEILKLERDTLNGAMNPGNSSATNSAVNGQSFSPQGKEPDVYLNPSEKITFGPNMQERVIEKIMSPSQVAEKSAYKEEKGRQAAKSYQEYAQKAQESATVGSEENQILEGMKVKYGDIPEWNKGILLGKIAPLSGESKIYEALYSGAVLNVLADQKGVASEGDRQRIEQTYPDRTFSEESVEELATLREIINDRKIEKQQFISRNPDFSPEKLESAWNKWVGDNSMFESDRYKKFLAKRRSKMSPVDSRIDELKEINRMLGE